MGTQFQRAGITLTDAISVDVIEFIESNRPGPVRNAPRRHGAVDPYSAHWRERYPVRSWRLLCRRLQFYTGLIATGVNMLVVPDAFYYRRMREGSLSAGDRISLLRHDADASEDFINNPALAFRPDVRRALQARLDLDREQLACREIRSGRTSRGSASSSLTRMVCAGRFVVKRLLDRF